MAGVIDVAAYILRGYGAMTTMRPQKCFCAQAQSLSCYDVPLFDEDFEARRGGPVCRELYARHRGKIIIRDGDLLTKENALDDAGRSIINAVCTALGGQTGNRFSARTHSESPWLNARNGTPNAAPCNAIISKDSISAYYRLNPIITA